MGVIQSCVKGRRINLSEAIPAVDEHTLYNLNKTGNSNKLRFRLDDIVPEATKRELRSLSVDPKQLQLGDIIGKGKFGVVFKGTLKDKNLSNPMEVAVKTVQGVDCKPSDVKAFLAEVMRLKEFKHPHVITLIGVAIRDDRPYVILPFMDLGDLKGVLSDSKRTFNIADLLGFGAQVASGMFYLASKKYVHRDLAARNVMVSQELQVKVADFGLSRDIYSEEYYRMGDAASTPLPIRWMALECISEQIFSEKTDVWSFGVLLWELFTRGKTPYTGMDNTQVIGYVNQGKRLIKPPHVPDEIYNIMLHCWMDRSNLRPTFEIIAETLSELLLKKGAIKDAKIDGPEARKGNLYTAFAGKKKRKSNECYYNITQKPEAKVIERQQKMSSLNREKKLEAESTTIAYENVPTGKETKKSGNASPTKPPLSSNSSSSADDGAKQRLKSASDEKHNKGKQVPSNNDTRKVETNSPPKSGSKQTKKVTAGLKQSTANKQESKDSSISTEETKQIESNKGKRKK